MRLTVLCGIAVLFPVFNSAHANSRDQLVDYLTRAEAYGFSGAVSIAKDNELLVEQGFGFANRARGLRATPQTAFDVGSITKQFTAAAILHLEMSGKLSTSDPLSKHLDFVPEDKSSVTIHHALTHTSGIGDDYWDQNRTLSEREYLTKVLNKRALGAPGERFRYSNAGYHLLKAIIEKVSGESYEAYLRNHLFLPLGMEHSGFLMPEWDDGQVAQYEDWTTRSWLVPVANPVKRPVYLQPEGSGGLLSTVGDMYKWQKALLNHDVLSEAATEKLFTPFLDGYAYGWRIGKTERRTSVIHHGGYDNSLGTVAGCYMYPDENAVIILLANTTMNLRMTHSYMVRSLESILFGGDVAWPPAPVAVEEPGLDRFAGTYTLPDGTPIEVTVENDRLMANVDDESAIRLFLFPNAGTIDEENGQEDPIETLFMDIDKGRFKRVEEALSPSLDAGRFERVWMSRWKRFVDSHGPLEEVRLVHQFPFIFDGQPEEQNFVLVRFEKFATIYRAIRNDSGWFNFSDHGIPERLELTLARTGPRAFAAWDYRLQMGPEIEFAGEPGSREMIIRGTLGQTAAKE